MEAIPAGITLSYKELAVKSGNIKVSRAVARANGTKPDFHSYSMSPCY